jgi:hypothetical protein
MFRHQRIAIRILPPKLSVASVGHGERAGCGKQRDGLIRFVQNRLIEVEILAKAAGQ